MADTANNWQSLLVTGKIDEALLAYRLADASDDKVVNALEALVAMREALRGKLWLKAAKYLEELEEPAAIVDWQSLLGQVEQLRLGAELLDKRQPEEALAFFKNLDAPLIQSEIEALQGTAYIYLNEPDLAKLAFEQALELDPRHYRAMTNLANLALEAGQTDEAIALYEKVLRINDGFANALHNLGVAYRKKGQLNKSVQLLRKAQAASQRQLKEEARGSLKLGSPQALRRVRWLIYGGIALLVFFLLRSQGLI